MLLLFSAFFWIRATPSMRPIFWSILFLGRLACARAQTSTRAPTDERARTHRERDRLTGRLRQREREKGKHRPCATVSVRMRSLFLLRLLKRAAAEEGSLTGHQSPSPSLPLANPCTQTWQGARTSARVGSGCGCCLRVVALLALSQPSIAHFLVYACLCFLSRVERLARDVFFLVCYSPSFSCVCSCDGSSSVVERSPHHFFFLAVCAYDFVVPLGVRSTWVLLLWWLLRRLSLSPSSLPVFHVSNPFPSRRLDARLLPAAEECLHL